MIKRIISKVKRLEEKYGGKWTYHRPSRTWHCDDGAYVRYVSNNFNNEYWEDENANPPSLVIYNTGDAPHTIYL